MHQFAYPTRLESLCQFLVAFLCISALMMFVSEPVFAAITTAVGNTLCNIAEIAQGNLGQGLAIIAIIIIGVGASLGKVSWGMAILVGVGIAVIFGAGSLLSMMGAGTTNGCAGVH